jgi:hypothetical protein
LERQGVRVRPPAHRPVPRQLASPRSHVVQYVNSVVQLVNRSVRTVNNSDSHRRRRYGLSPDEYEAIAASQGYVCSVCEQPNWVGHSGETKPLVVDHNHATNANRGLLCDRCNKVLGFLRDRQELALRILEYLRRHDGPCFERYVPDNHATREARQAAWDASFEQPSELPAEQCESLKASSPTEQVSLAHD